MSSLADMGLIKVGTFINYTYVFFKKSASLLSIMYYYVLCTMYYKIYDFEEENIFIYIFNFVDVFKVAEILYST